MKNQPASPLLILRQRRRRQAKIHRGAARRVQRLAFGTGTLLAVLAVLLIIAGALVYASYTSNLPSLEGLQIALDPVTGLLLQPTRLYDRSGQHLLAVLAPTDAPRQFIPYADLPQSLVDATLALMQPDFWQSPGYATEGWQDQDSHPTIAQKLVSDFLLADELPGSRRAIRERLLAAQVTARYGREQVLAWSLNSTDYGHYAYGIEAASQLYLGKSAMRLDLSEAALLAGVGRTPALNPLDAPAAAESNRLETLALMLSLGFITPEEAQAADIEVPLILPPGEAAAQIVSQQFVDLVLRQLDVALGARRVEHGGSIILTSIDYGLQLQADCALRTQLAGLSGQPAPTSAADGSDCIAAALLLPLEHVTTHGLSAGAVIMDPATGQVLAASGDLGAHPAGTAITPFIYLTGFVRGLDPASLGWDIPADEPSLGQIYHGAVRLRIALANDYLPPARSILERMGAENVRITAASFGLEFPISGLLENDFDLSPFDLAAAYSILAAEGMGSGRTVTAPGASPAEQLEPAVVQIVTHADNTLWLDWSVTERRPVLTSQLAYLLTHVLSDNAARWSSLGYPNALELDRPAAVKAAHTLDEKGAWTLGYTPQRTVLVYFSGAGKVSREASDGLWSALARTALQNLPAAGWEMPAGVVTLKVCDPSGLLPTDACPNVVDEIFLEGREPVQYDSLYHVFEINIETGLLATVFTPPDLVERRVYMVPPPEARQWAEASGLEVPPSTYDYFETPPVLLKAHITTPTMFTDGHGLVAIRGTAAGTDFVSYRLEFGTGLNPETWTLLGGDVTTPVNEGLLATWDTTGLDGLYSLRLMVVRTDHRVDEAILQLTLDNTPPEVQLFHPLDGEEIDLLDEPYIVFQAQVEEAFLDEVVFTLDGVEVGSVREAPFWVVWKASAGEHTIKITATDRVGNEGAVEVRFTVKK